MNMILRFGKKLYRNFYNLIIFSFLVVINGLLGIKNLDKINILGDVSDKTYFGLEFIFIIFAVVMYMEVKIMMLMANSSLIRILPKLLVTYLRILYFYSAKICVAVAGVIFTALFIYISYIINENLIVFLLIGCLASYFYGRFWLQLYKGIELMEPYSYDINLECGDIEYGYEKIIDNSFLTSNTFEVDTKTLAKLHFKVTFSFIKVK